MERQAFIDALAALYEPSTFRNHMSRFKDARGTQASFLQMDDVEFARFCAEHPPLLCAALAQPPVQGGDPLRAKQMYHLVAPAADKAGKLFSDLTAALAEVTDFVAKAIGGDLSAMRAGKRREIDAHQKLLDRVQQYLAALSGTAGHEYPVTLDALGFGAEAVASWVDFRKAVDDVEVAMTAAAATPASTASAVAPAGDDSAAADAEFSERATKLYETHKPLLEVLCQGGGGLMRYLDPGMASDEARATLYAEGLAEVLRMARKVSRPNGFGPKRLHSFARYLAESADEQASFREQIEREMRNCLETLARIDDYKGQGFVADKIRDGAARAMRIDALLKQLRDVEGLVVPAADEVGLDAQARGRIATVLAKLDGEDAAKADLAAKTQDFLPYFMETWRQHDDLVRALCGRGSGLQFGNREMILRFGEQVAGFDHAQIQQRFREYGAEPPEQQGFYRDVLDLQNLYKAQLDNSIGPELLAHVREYTNGLSSPILSTRAYSFERLSNARLAIRIFKSIFRKVDTSALLPAEQLLGEVFDPLWSQVAGGPAHEAMLGQIRFAEAKVDLAAADPGFPDTVDITKGIYLYAYSDRPLEWREPLNGRVSLMLGDTRVEVSLAANGMGKTAYLGLWLLPSENDALDAGLIRAAGAFLGALASGQVHEVPVRVLVDVVHEIAGGILQIDCRKLKPDALAKRVEKLAKLAEQRAARTAELPAYFADAYKPFKDPSLARDKIEAVIRESYSEIAELLSLRVVHHSREEFNVERNRLGQPVQRTSNGLAAVVFRGTDGKCYFTEDCLMFRQWWDFSGGRFGERTSVLAFGWNPVHIDEAKLAVLTD